VISMIEIQIDEEFDGLSRKLKDGEYSLLEKSILSEGVRDPLVVWRGILLDGHNRYEIANKHGMSYTTCETSAHIETRLDARIWIGKNQLAKRNLDEENVDYLLGCLYTDEKEQGRRTDLTSAQSEQKLTTAERLGKEYGVGQATVRRNEIYAEHINRIAEISIAAKDAILGRKIRSTKAHVQGVAVLPIDEMREIVKKIELGEVDSLASALRENRRAKEKEKLDRLANEEIEAPTGEYDVIVIDPPWDMKKIERDERPLQAELDYPTMSYDELEALTIPAADNCHVWLWTTQKYLPTAFELLEAWGLSYTCVFVWHKPGGFQVIGLPQYNCEFALYAEKGDPIFLDDKAFNTCFNAPRGAHSEKPEEFYDMVKRVTAGRRLDMFNRRKIEGFDSWGNEAVDEL